jgi:Glycosyl transferases group 1
VLVNMATTGESIEPYDPSTATRPLADVVLDALRERPDAPTDPDEFLAWAAKPEGTIPLSRFLTGVWRRRSDLNDLFPGAFLDHDAAGRLQLWAHHFLVADTGAPELFRPPAPPGVNDLTEPAFDGTPSNLAAGVTVVGYLRAAFGLGDAGRRLVELVRLAGEEVRALSYDHVNAPLTVPWPDPLRNEGASTDIVLLAVNGAESVRARHALGRKATLGRYVIGLWFWELEELSDETVGGFAAVDEVWVTSEFTADAVRRVAPNHVAVRVIPLGADITSTTTRRASGMRTRFAVPESAVVVGNLFDHASRIERKNPIGLIEAWTLAYPVADPTGRVLFLKSVNALTFPDAHASVVAAAGGRADIIVHDEFLSVDDRNALTAEFDVVASLHRSEGYGLTLLEAMHRGVPVIATGYSGNLAFMTDENSWLVPVTRTTLDEAAGPYPAGGTWAEPDLNVAASLLREIVDGLSSAEVSVRVERARESVRTLIDGSDGAAFVAQRLAQLRAER